MDRYLQLLLTSNLNQMLTINYSAQLTELTKFSDELKLLNRRSSHSSQVLHRSSPHFELAQTRLQPLASPLHKNCYRTTAHMQVPKNASYQSFDASNRLQVAVVYIFAPSSITPPFL